MIRVVPDFHPEFACIASRCGHSCCMGWEVDVDEDSLERYSGIPDALGAKLRREIDMTSSPHFRLDSRERCPFLTEENLCQLILELGEDSLCQICTDHPRFRSWFPDRVEEGLGLCCEEAGRLLLDRLFLLLGSLVTGSDKIHHLAGMCRGGIVLAGSGRLLLFLFILGDFGSGWLLHLGVSNSVGGIRHGLTHFKECRLPLMLQHDHLCIGQRRLGRRLLRHNGFFYRGSGCLSR